MDYYCSQLFLEFGQLVNYTIKAIKFKCFLNSCVVPAQMVLSLSVCSILVVALQLDCSDLLVTLHSFSTLLSRSFMLIDLDSAFKTFLILFILQTAMISGFILYCDDPWVSYLDTKILLFYLTVCNLGIAVAYLHQLLCFEIIGLLSFRLIGHYMDRINATRGAHIAVGTNRIADVLLAVLLIKATTANALAWTFDPAILDFLLIALAVKSISVFSYMWLPDAMEGPTPVSALLHSATLVIAGILVFTRTSSNYQISTLSSLIIAGTFLVMISHLNDPDSKKCAAISTCIMLSLLWIETIASASGSWNLAIAHANYKSTFFVLLGYVLTISGAQDLRAYNWSSSSISNIAIAAILLYSLSLAGTFYTYSKIGSKIMVHGSPSLVRYSASLILLISSLALYALWIGVFFSTVSNDSVSTMNSIPAFVLTWCFIILVTLSLHILPVGIAGSQVWSSSILVVLSLVMIMIWLGRNFVTWSLSITSVHLTSSSRALHASITYFSWLLPFMAFSRASLRGTILMFIVFMCLA